MDIVYLPVPPIQDQEIRHRGAYGRHDERDDKSMRRPVKQEPERH